MQHCLDIETDLTNCKDEYIVLSPNQVPAIYHDELLKVITAFIDCELAAAAGFADFLKYAPTMQQHINVAHLVSEKMEHAKVLLNIMSELDGESRDYIDRLQGCNRFDWAARIDRNADILLGPSISDDKRVAVLYYPIQNWLDGVTMYVLMEKAAKILIAELSKIFYKPLAVACNLVMTSEQAHAHLSCEELMRLAQSASINKSVNLINSNFDYWLNRSRAIFDPFNLPYFEQLRLLGLSHRSNEDMLDEFNTKADKLRQRLNLAMKL